MSLFSRRRKPYQNPYERPVTQAEYEADERRQITRTECPEDLPFPDESTWVDFVAPGVTRKVVIDGPPHPPLPAGAEDLVVEVEPEVAQMRHWLGRVRPADFGRAS
jgi:hypothetical protein